MNVGDLQWLAGFGLTFTLAIAGIVIGAFRAMSGKLDRAIKEMREAVENGDKELHSRINRLREDVSNNYVRRIDLESHMQRTDAQLQTINSDQKVIMKTLAALEARQK